MTRVPSAPATPAEIYGPLLAAVQEAGILADGKTFVDAVPQRGVEEIVRAFADIPAGNEALRSFVADNFILPPSGERPQSTRGERSLRSHIRATWRQLERPPHEPGPASSALPVRHPHAVPGGRFREMYYWDSFFTMMGLVRDGRRDLAAGIVNAMTELIETYGHVPNGTRSYFVGRSQPPVFHLMAALLGDDGPGVAARRLAAMKREHAWWMDGAEALGPGGRAGHVVRLPDGALLNRYWDARTTPRDESWREDVETASQDSRSAAEVFRNLRAGAESGWDFSSRWCDRGLPSIRTTAIVPVDLNALLFGLERAIAAAGGAEDRRRYGALAKARREAMQRLWDQDGGYFTDYDLDESALRPRSTAAALAPLLTGVATQEQADATARHVENYYLAPGGLRTTLVESGEQWDRPNGWAPLQWIAVAGLRRYGHEALARDIALRWIETVDGVFQQTGAVYEKYDVEKAAIGGGGEYEPQIGFGWTNGVTADFIDTYGEASNEGDLEPVGGLDASRERRHGC